MNRTQLQLVQQHLAHTKGQHKRIADASGIPYSTIRKISMGISKNPRSDTVQGLFDYFENSHYKPPQATA